MKVALAESEPVLAKTERSLHGRRVHSLSSTATS